MNTVIMMVRDYYNSGYQQRNLDTDLLTTCVGTLTDGEIEYIKQHSAETVNSEDAEYKFFMKKILRRYEDLLAGNTRVDESGLVTFTKSSSITELCEDSDVYAACKESGIKRISDVSVDACKQKMPLNLAMQLLAALLVFEVEE